MGYLNTFPCKINFILSGIDVPDGKDTHFLKENERVTIVDWIQRYGSYIKLKRTTISLAVSIFDKLTHVN